MGDPQYIDMVHQSLQGINFGAPLLMSQSEWETDRYRIVVCTFFSAVALSSSYLCMIHPI